MGRSRQACAIGEVDHAFERSEAYQMVLKTALSRWDQSCHAAALQWLRKDGAVHGGACAWLVGVGVVDVTEKKGYVVHEQYEHWGVEKTLGTIGHGAVGKEGSPGQMGGHWNAEVVQEDLKGVSHDVLGVRMRGKVEKGPFVPRE